MLKQVTIECDVPDGWEAVAFRFPKSGEYYIGGVAEEPALAERAFSIHAYLIIRPVTPKMVPLGPEDIVPGTAVRRGVTGLWRMVLWADNDCVHFSPLAPHISQEAFAPYDELQSEGWLYKTPSMTEWAKCEKAAT